MEKLKNKICKKCDINKPIKEYYKHNISNDGYRYKCKKCISLERKSYYLNNKEKVKENTDLYYSNNKEKVKDRNKNNNKKIKKYQRKYRIERRKNDKLFKLTENIRTLIYLSIKNKKINKKSKTKYILGCDFELFKQYLEMQWKPWMCWDNYGKYDGNFHTGWDLDHIKPVSLGKTEEEILKLNHYTNFQPLCSYINRDKKRNKY